MATFLLCCDKMLFRVSLFLIVFSLVNSDDNGIEDWTAGCPKLACKCKWASGKRTAMCQNAELRSLPKFKNPERIQVLELESNQIRVLPDQIFKKNGLLNLQKIYMQNCSISEIHSSAFRDLTLLIELDLSRNQISKLVPGTFKGNYRIRKLWLSHNPIKNLEGFSFPSIDHLRLLDLSHCQLTTFGRATFILLQYLEVLHLHDNLLTYLEKSVFKPVLNLKSLTLERNPWICDCNLMDFWQWLMKNKLFNLPTACAVPKKLEGVTWDKLDEGTLACSPTVLIPEPMVTVSTNDVVRLACLAKGIAHLSWIRSGMVIANNSKSAGSNYFQYYTIKMKKTRWSLVAEKLQHQKNRSNVVNSIQARHVGMNQQNVASWFNLTIKNVHPSGSGVYTCVAQNPGGIAEGNVTVVYSESVATYLERSEMSVLLIMGVSTGIMVFLCIGFTMVAFIAKIRYGSGSQRSIRSRIIEGGGKASHLPLSTQDSAGENVRLKASGVTEDAEEFEMCQMLKQSQEEHEEEKKEGIYSSSFPPIKHEPNCVRADLETPAAYDSAICNGEYQSMKAKLCKPEQKSYGNGSENASSSIDSAISAFSSGTPTLASSPTPSMLDTITIASNPTTSLMEKLWRQDIGSRTQLLQSDLSSTSICNSSSNSWASPTYQRSNAGSIGPIDLSGEWGSHSLTHPRNNQHLFRPQKQEFSPKSRPPVLMSSSPNKCYGQLRQANYSPMDLNKSDVMHRFADDSNSQSNFRVDLPQSRNSHHHPYKSRDPSSNSPTEGMNDSSTSVRLMQQHSNRELERRKHYFDCMQQQTKVGRTTIGSNGHFLPSKTSTNSNSCPVKQTNFVSSSKNFLPQTNNRKSESFASEQEKGIAERNNLLEALVKDKSDTIV